MRTVFETLALFPHAPGGGLTAAQAAESHERHGRNTLTPLPKESAWSKFVAKFEDPIIRILLSASLISMTVDLFKMGAGYVLPLGFVAAMAVVFGGILLMRRGRWLVFAFLGFAMALLVAGLMLGHLLFEGLAVMVAVLLATGVAFLSEYKSDREFELLNEGKEPPAVKVVRGGIQTTIPAHEVAVGDIVLLGTGDEVPADGRVLEATELNLDQSLMNGESEPSAKLPAEADKAAGGPGEIDCLYRGTYVVEGIGRMLVTEVGDATEFGVIARKLAGDDGVGEAGGRVRDKLSISKEPTPLQRKLEGLARLISRAGYAAAAIVFVVLVVGGILRGDLALPAEGADAGAVWFQNLSLLLEYFVYMVVIVVVAVPEGLPMSVTVSLALAMRKITRSNCLVRQLVACETVGSTTIICTDKTGTLTQNRMSLEKLAIDGHWLTDAKATAVPGDKGFEALTATEWIGLVSAVDSTAYLEEKEGKTVVVGSSTEGALLRWIGERGAAYGDLRLRFPALAVFPFSSDRKRMTTVVEWDGRAAVLCKGAPERIIASCTHVMAEDGTVQPWDAESRQATEAMLHDAAGQAMRTLAFAVALLPGKVDAASLRSQRDQLESNLTYVGFAAIRDPLRPEVYDAIAECRRAGIKVQMITGDTIDTARAIGREIGLLEDADSIVLTSAEFNAMSDEELTAILPKLRILARAQPLDKLRMVKLHQARAEVVAVTGDGTNDAPALKQADVGLAMGIAGTEVSKEASKLVLLDDSFATIVKAVFWGRALYENIQRFIMFQLTINLSALGITLIAPFLGFRAPFTVLQFLWINVIMDTFAALALCSEPPRKALMLMPPKRRDESIVTRSMLRTLVSTAAFYAVVML
nr:calcium-translocating P-type ATPase, PMCA-type [Candidatus Peribacteraceae bacterium]